MEQADEVAQLTDRAGRPIRALLKELLRLANQRLYGESSASAKHASASKDVH